MTNLATTSLIDRGNLERDAVRREISRGLEGADDGELFLEYGQTEALAFDNGRLKQATHDTSQGVGLRAVKDDAVGYAHRLQLLHLDLKPANVLINERDEPLVADFGLARHMNATG